MTENKKMIDIGSDEVLSRVQSYQQGGYRLVQMCCVREPAGNVPADHLELHYTFGRDYEMVDLKFSIPPGEAIESITQIYPCAFLYENEIHDLYGVSIQGINIDFQGNFYKVAAAHPFNPDIEPGQAQKEK